AQLPLTPLQLPVRPAVPRPLVAVGPVLGRLDLSLGRHERGEGVHPGVEVREDAGLGRQVSNRVDGRRPFLQPVDSSIRIMTLTTQVPRPSAKPSSAALNPPSSPPTSAKVSGTTRPIAAAWAMRSTPERGSGCGP